MDTRQQKEELRQKLWAKRLAMDEAEIKQKSQAIAEKLVYAINLPSVRHVHIYRSVTDWREVDTKPIEEAIRANSPGVQITFAEAEKDQPLPRELYDLIIVPVLGFDRHNHRLGLGGGFYDRFLIQQPQAQKVGLAFADSLVAEGLPHEVHDVALDKIVTEQDTISL